MWAGTFKLLQRLSMVVMVVFALSCTPKYYFPTMHNVPLITERNEIQAGGYFTFTDASANLAGSPLKHLGLQVNMNKIISMAFGRGVTSVQSLSEAGIGFYTMVHKEFVIESYLVSAIGNSKNAISAYYDDNNTYIPGSSISTSFRKNGAQLNFGFKYPTGIIGIGLKITQLNFYNIQGALTYGGQNQFEYLSENNKLWLLEPAFTYRIGGEHVQFNVQCSTSKNLTKADFRQAFLRWGMGMTFNFVIKKKKLPE